MHLHTAQALGRGNAAQRRRGHCPAKVPLEGAVCLWSAAPNSWPRPCWNRMHTLPDHNAQIISADWPPSSCRGALSLVLRFDRLMIDATDSNGRQYTITTASQASCHRVALGWCRVSVAGRRWPGRRKVRRNASAGKGKYSTTSP